MARGTEDQKLDRRPGRSRRLPIRQHGSSPAPNITDCRDACVSRQRRTRTRRSRSSYTGFRFGSHAANNRIVVQPQYKTPASDKHLSYGPTVCQYPPCASVHPQPPIRWRYNLALTIAHDWQSPPISDNSRLQNGPVKICFSLVASLCFAGGVHAFSD